MVKASDLLRSGKNEELWQMCCGHIKLNLEQFMLIQRRQLLNQIEYLNHSKIGRRITGNAIIRTVEDFRQSVPLTTYANYCPELAEKREDSLPEKPAQWVHTSGLSGVNGCKWIPLSNSFIQNLSPLLYGLGLLSSCTKWGDSSHMPKVPKIIYTVAPRPYISGAFASMIEEQTPVSCHPALEKAETLSFDDRIKLGFEETLTCGLDYFFGLSIVLSIVGDKFSQSTGKADIRAFLANPKALVRMACGMARARLEKRNLLPRDLWHVKGIITSGLDSSVFKEKIKNYWGRYPLDIYACTEAGVIATQTWDYSGMTFIPNLNFLEFIPEKEHLKWRLEPDYQPKTVLLDEVKAGESYEIVISNFHGGALMRYRIGDIIRITALKNENLGIDIPQMEFERRADDLIDLVVIRLTEKIIWKAIEQTAVPYEDWIAFRTPGERTVNILLELKDGFNSNESELSKAIHAELLKADNEDFDNSRSHLDEINSAGLKTRVVLLQKGSFNRYKDQKSAAGADIAHLKPPHINPAPEVITTLLSNSNVSPAYLTDRVSRKTPISVQ